MQRHRGWLEIQKMKQARWREALLVMLGGIGLLQRAMAALQGLQLKSDLL